MNIDLSKLGITPIQRHENKITGDMLFSEHEIRKVEKQRDEMLKALIELGEKSDVYDRIFSSQIDRIIRGAIELTANKPWGTVKKELGLWENQWVNTEGKV